MNALLKAPLRFNPALVRWSISTDPQLGHVWSTEEDLSELGTNYSVHRFPYLDHERILANSTAGGWIKVLVRSSTGRILGASLLGPDVVSQIPLLSLSVQNGVTLKQFMNTVLPQFGHTGGSATPLREGAGDSFAASDRLSQLVASLWP
jgi:pyruvate/2-oxoglutarate dehydrogenase complex dihydrolipoamide dehydrogenase (E3) component